MTGGKAFQNLALAALSLAVGLALAELGVRLFLGPVPPPNLTLVPESLRAPSPFPEIPYLLAPGAEALQDFGSNPRGYFDGDGTLRYRINAVGLRDREVERAKAPGTFRILGIGDSFTFGTGARLEDLFLTRLQRRLDAESPPGRYQVLNLGVMGFNTAHELALLRDVGLGFEPDLVLVCFVLNDAEVLAPGAADAAARAAPARGASLLLDHLRARFARRRLRREAIARTRADYRPDAPGWKLAQYSLLEMRNLARREGFALGLVLFPYLWQLDDAYPFADAHAAIARTARRLGLPFLDLLPAFRGEDGESLWVHPSNQHPNERAHAIAAEAIHGWLRQTGLLEPSAARGE